MPRPHLNPVPHVDAPFGAIVRIPRRYSWHHLPSGKRGASWCEACTRGELLAALNTWNVQGNGAWLYTASAADDSAEMPT